MKQAFAAACSALLALSCGHMDMQTGDTQSSVKTGHADSKGEGTVRTSRLALTIGPEGGELKGAPDSVFAGLRLVIPAGALARAVEVSIEQAHDVMPLPATARACGPMFTLQPAGLELDKVATLTLPYDEEIVADNYRFEDEVRVWILGAKRWTQEPQIDSTPGSVTVEIDHLNAVAAGVNPPDQVNITKFALHPNPKFVNCLAAYPGDAKRAPVANVTVVRGDQRDSLFLRGSNFRPGVGFTLFMVENGELLADGSANANFDGNFGAANYLTDFDASSRGRLNTSVRTILLDQNFVFDQGANLEPVSMFQVGFWFNDPNDAAACGFDPEKPTPFNEDHEAGPNAMISLPDATSGLGPLCTNADTSVSPARCIVAED